jgi:hypothetical protein
MKKSLALLLAPVLMLTGMVFAGDAVIVVIDNKLVKADQIVSPTITFTGTKNAGASAVAPGDIAVVGATVSNQYPTYVKTQSFEWTVSENGYMKRVWSNGNKVMFGAGINPTTIQVDVKATFVYTVGTSDVTITATKSDAVVVAGPTPTPTPVPPTPTPPNPTPTPPSPTPPVPPTPTPVPALTGAAKFAYDSAMTYGPADKSSAAVLSSSFAQIAAQIGNNTAYNDPATLLNDTHEANNAALAAKGYKGLVWDNWGKALQNYLWDLYQAKGLATTDDFKKVWGEIATGLSYVK